MFTAPTSSDIIYTVSTANAVFTASLPITNNLGDPGHIRIKKGIGSLDEILEDGAELIFDTELEFWAHKYDKGGNCHNHCKQKDDNEEA